MENCLKKKSSQSSEDHVQLCQLIDYWLKIRVWGGFWLCGTVRRRWGFLSPVWWTSGNLWPSWALQTKPGRGEFFQPSYFINPTWQVDEGQRFSLCPVCTNCSVLGLVAPQLARWQIKSPIYFSTPVPLSPAQVSRQKRAARAGSRNEWSHQKVWEMWKQLEKTARQNIPGTCTKGACGELTMLEAERCCLGLKRKALGHWTAGNQGSVVLLLREQLVFRAWQYCIVVKCVWKDWFIAIMIYESPPDTYLRGCGGVQ